MKEQFYLHFETMPKSTAQQKGVRVVYGKPRFYEKKNTEDARRQFTLALKEHAPVKPSDKPIRLTIWFAFDVKNKKLWSKEVSDTQWEEIYKGVP